MGQAGRFAALWWGRAPHSWATEGGLARKNTSKKEHLEQAAWCLLRVAPGAQLAALCGLRLHLPEFPMTTLKSQIDKSLDTAKTGIADAGKKLGVAVQHGMEGVEEAVEDAGEVASKAATAVQDVAGTAVQKAKKGAHALADVASHAAHEVADATKHAAEEVVQAAKGAAKEVKDVTKKVLDSDGPTSNPASKPMAKPMAKPANATKH